jgi:hypothetical protein
MSSNQGLWADFGVVEELTEQAAETISGGAEVFGIYNNTNADITYSIDGKFGKVLSGEEFTYITGGSGLITFDYDVRAAVTATKSYNLADGGNYYFDPNDNTANPYDVDLYIIA